MAEEVKEPAMDDKSSKVQTPAAPTMDESEGGSSETLDGEDIDDVLTLLNIVDKEIGGNGEIAGIPDELRNSFKYIVDKLIFVRDLFEDPLWKSILDDMADQKEDGKTPSVEVAIARNIPLEKLQTLAESEDYEGTQTELTSNMEAGKKAEEEEMAYEANFEASKKAGEEYAAEMGYDEDEKNSLFQLVLDLLKITADGILTIDEFRKVDKMRNYDKDIEDLRSQIKPKETKEVLPDKSSVDAKIKTQIPKVNKPANGPGIGSLSAYQNVATDVTQIGSRRRGK